MAGRPTDCTPETTAKVCEALKLGVSLADAAAHSGIPSADVESWVSRGAAGEAPFASFVEQAERARAQFRVRIAAMMMKAAQEGDMQAAKWLAENADPAPVADQCRPKPSTWSILARSAGGHG